jgi:hypothetical protein
MAHLITKPEILSQFLKHCHPDNQNTLTLTPPHYCHPEPSFGRRICRDDWDLIAVSRLFGQGFWRKSQYSANSFVTFREILRPKDGSG